MIDHILVTSNLYNHIVKILKYLAKIQFRSLPSPSRF